MEGDGSKGDEAVRCQGSEAGLNMGKQQVKDRCVQEASRSFVDVKRPVLACQEVQLLWTGSSAVGKGM